MGRGGGGGGWGGVGGRVRVLASCLLCYEKVIFLFCQNVELNATDGHESMHENQGTVSHVFFSGNDIFKKL